MALYTLILDYVGGTYLYQTEAGDECEALHDWIAQLRLQLVATDVSAEIATAFENWLAHDPVPLGGLVGAWCTSANAERGLALVNIIRTSA
jgi:hypothetical protein